MPGRRYLDAGKPLFYFATRIISSVHIQVRFNSLSSTTYSKNLLNYR